MPFYLLLKLYAFSQVYKFGGQPYVNDFLSRNFRSGFVSTFGEKNGKAVTSAVAGSLIGIGEIVLLPRKRERQPFSRLNRLTVDTRSGRSQNQEANKP